MYIGLDIGGTKVLGALFDEHGNILKRAKKKTKAIEGREVVFDQISKVIDILLENINKEEIKGIGAGAPGLIDSQSGIINFSPNLPWDNYNLKGEIEEKYNLKTFLGNDVNVGILGEWKYGAAKTLSNVLGIFVGTGIGGGIITNGKLYDGSIGAAGELGHIIIDPTGPHCGCGARGCLESLASKTAMVQQIHAQIRRGKISLLKDRIKESGGILKSSHLREGFDKKDDLTLEILNNATKNIGIAMASFLNILNPEMIVFGGGIMEELGEVLLPKIKAEASLYAMPKIYEACDFKLAQLGDNAGIYGALALVTEGVKNI